MKIERNLSSVIDLLNSVKNNVVVNETFYDLQRGRKRLERTRSATETRHRFYLELSYLFTPISNGGSLIWNEGSCEGDSANTLKGEGLPLARHPLSVGASTVELSFH